MKTQTTGRRAWLAAGLVAVALAAAAMWAVLTFDADTKSRPKKAPVAVRLSASEMAYLSGLASMWLPRVAATSRPASGGQPSAAGELKELAPPERRYVRGILTLTPEQLRAGFGTVHP